MVVGLLVGGWFASTVISKLINELIEYANDQKKMQLGLKDELTRLEKALPKIQAVVNAVDQGLIRKENPALEKWLWQLRDAADQADDVMDEIKYDYEKERALKAEKNKVDKVITNFKTFFLRAVEADPFLKRLKKAVKAIDEVAADVVEFYILVQGLNKDQKEVVKSAISNRQTSSVLNVGTRVFGRKKEKENVIKKLLNPVCKTKGKNFAVLPIIGVGGVGKTTLVQLVYNDPTVIQHFELRIWVCISNNFDVELITKKLYEFVFKKKADFESFALIQMELLEKLKCKRFLVVFDDVWNENDKLGWEKLVAPLQHGKSGSMILLTTRLKTVATLVGPNVMDSITLESLNESDMWDLFKEYVFGGEDPDFHKEVVEIGRDIVKKLKGSPLAAKTVGGILCSDLSELHWRNILESELWSLEQTHNDIMPSLRLTYQYLSPHLKPCFSFCSIFPQDHVFGKHDLINMWIALGMVPLSANSTMRPEDVGSKYFDDMVSKSIFIHSEYGRFVMDDLIHDLSIFVSQGECLRTSTNNMESIPNTVRHLYVHIHSSCGLNISGLINLRTLILNFDYCEPDSLVTEMLKGMEKLRLLILFGHNWSEIPECVNKLLHLRYLNISSSTIDAVPKSVSRLYLLETMVCNGFYRGQPKQVNAWGRLINLRHLTAPKELLDNTACIGRLTSLQVLEFSVGKDDGFKICELSDMRDLRCLTIDGIENVGSGEEVKQANLKDKINLNQLNLYWESSTEPNKPHLNEYVLDHLEPHHGLKGLSMWYYNDTGRPPIWFTTQALSKLIYLTIYRCTFENLPCLEELPLLKYIDFDKMNAVKVIIHKCNLSSAVDAFPSLKELSFIGMEQLKKWCLAKQPNKWMQCLRKLKVKDCPNLQILPPVPVGVKELRFKRLGLNALPNFWNDQSSKSGSLSDLVHMSIRDCENIVSLNEGLLQSPERFVALEYVKIGDCGELMNLPPGGFNKLISLKELEISECPKIVVQEECFLPSALQRLYIRSCGHLDTTLSKALENVHSLNRLSLYQCANITSLPPKEVFSRWTVLKKLTFDNCPNLASLESLLGLSSIKDLSVYDCPELSRPISSPLPLEKDETDRKEDGTMQTSDRNDEFNNWFSECSRKAPSYFQSMLCTLFYLVIKMFIPKLERSVSTQPQLPSPITHEKPLLSVNEIHIDDPLLLSIEPIRSLSAVNKLTIQDCSKLQSLPKLPPILQELHINRCCPEFQMRCEKSGPDWHKLSQIPKVQIGINLQQQQQQQEQLQVQIGINLHQQLQLQPQWLQQLQRRRLKQQQQLKNSKSNFDPM